MCSISISLVPYFCFIEFSSGTLIFGLKLLTLEAWGRESKLDDGIINTLKNKHTHKRALELEITFDELHPSMEHVRIQPRRRSSSNRNFPHCVSIVSIVHRRTTSFSPVASDHRNSKF